MYGILGSMNLSNTQKVFLWAGLIIIIIVLGALWHYVGKSTPATTMPAESTTTPVAVATTTPGAPAMAKQFPINPADSIASWTFTGSYSGNATLVAQANADIAHLQGLVGKGHYNDYDLYDGIANDETNLGQGQSAYRDYNRAIDLYPGTGLAYMNLGHLMDMLGAEQTAADAYAKSVAVEPGTLAYHLARLTFLTTRLPSDSARIMSAFSDASKQFGDSAPVLSIEAEWLTGQGRYADAITAWKKVEQLSPASSQASIESAIAALQAKLNTH